MKRYMILAMMTIVLLSLTAGTAYAGYIAEKEGIALKSADNNNAIGDDNTTVIIANYPAQTIAIATVPPGSEVKPALRVEKIDSRHISVIIGNPYDKTLYASGNIHVFDSKFKNVSDTEISYEIPAKGTMKRTVTIRSNISSLEILTSVFFSFEPGRFNGPLVDINQKWITLTDYRLLGKEIIYDQITASVALIILLLMAWFVYKREKDNKKKN